MPHPPTRACEAVHCHSHHEDEPVGAAALVCGECGHGFATDDELVDAARAKHAEVGLTDMVPTTADEVLTCPFCSHDL